MSECRWGAKGYLSCWAGWLPGGGDDSTSGRDQALVGEQVGSQLVPDGGSYEHEPTGLWLQGLWQPPWSPLVLFTAWVG